MQCREVAYNNFGPNASNWNPRHNVRPRLALQDGVAIPSNPTGGRQSEGPRDDHRGLVARSASILAALHAAGLDTTMLGGQVRALETRRMIAVPFYSPLELARERVCDARRALAEAVREAARARRRVRDARTTLQRGVVRLRAAEVALAGHRAPLVAEVLLSADVLHLPGPATVSELVPLTPPDAPPMVVALLYGLRRPAADAASPSTPCGQSLATRAGQLLGTEGQQETTSSSSSSTSSSASTSRSRSRRRATQRTGP